MVMRTLEQMRKEVSNQHLDARHCHAIYEAAGTYSKRQWQQRARAAHLLAAVSRAA